MWKSPLLEPLNADACRRWNRLGRLPALVPLTAGYARNTRSLSPIRTHVLADIHTNILHRYDVNLVQINIIHAERICTNNMMAAIDGREGVSKTPLATRLTVTRPEERRFTCSKPVSRLTFASSKCIIMVFIWCSTASIM